MTGKSMRNKQEQDMVSALQKKRAVEAKVDREFDLFKQMLPAIRAAIKANGGADAVLKKSETIAAMELIKATQSEKDEVRLKAATEILNRTIGRPIERSVNIYGDISKMNEADVDSQILMLLEKTGAKQLVSDTLGVRTKPRKQKRKPRKADPFVIEATVTQPTEGPDTSTETGTPSDS